ncbi:Protein MUM2 [Nakaseomyces glabratus]|uniref:Protein MUM2 n=1 Tax=Candida glabrata TaxID=5478 RepID=A0A0W0CM30_CANGB|nr:hypothetical protein J7298_02513 [Nakaseomyces glabratus]KAH7601050.1 hypothetical protein J7295_02519 [Nakaseomyces glabratus]KAH7613489.1 hypothetical protein J7292_02496 [Nakaseomyces glabratus]KTA96061.1 Protein MUM2 [Nakaseomyces glabratus]KTA97478.1 Protein MUM2 [Nakaseomyces glabratus]
MSYFYNFNQGDGFANNTSMGTQDQSAFQNQNQNQVQNQSQGKAHTQFGSGQTYIASSMLNGMSGSSYSGNYEKNVNSPQDASAYANYFQPLQNAFNSSPGFQTVTQNNLATDYSYSHANSNGNNQIASSGSTDTTTTDTTAYNVSTNNDRFPKMTSDLTHMTSQQSRYPNTTSDKGVDDQLFTSRYNSMGTLTSTSTISSIPAKQDNASYLGQVNYNGIPSNRNYTASSTTHSAMLGNSFTSDAVTGYYYPTNRETNKQGLINSTKLPSRYSGSDNGQVYNNATTFDATQSSQPSNCSATVNPKEPKESSGEIDTLKYDIQVKDAQLQFLQRELTRLKSAISVAVDNTKDISSKTADKEEHITTKEIDVPNSLDIIFRKLSSALQKREKELDETKTNLESVLAAMALNPSNSSTKFGRYDPENLAHKTVVRLETLTKENQEMARMLSFGRAKEKHIALELLKKENKDLKTQIIQLKEKLGKDKV